MVSVVDEALANVTNALRAKAMWPNSITVLSNDNGGWIGYGGINYPYRVSALEVSVDSMPPS